jgi:hypothetical protein
MRRTEKSAFKEILLHIADSNDFELSASAPTSSGT